MMPSLRRQWLMLSLAGAIIAAAIVCWTHANPLTTAYAQGGPAPTPLPAVCNPPPMNYVDADTGLWASMSRQNANFSSPTDEFQVWPYRTVPPGERTGTLNTTMNLHPGALISISICRLSPAAVATDSPDRTWFANVRIEFQARDVLGNRIPELESNFTDEYIAPRDLGVTKRVNWRVPEYNKRGRVSFRAYIEMEYTHGAGVPNDNVHVGKRHSAFIGPLDLYFVGVEETEAAAAARSTAADSVYRRSDAASIQNVTTEIDPDIPYLNHVRISWQAVEGADEYWLNTEPPQIARLIVRAGGDAVTASTTNRYIDMGSGQAAGAGDAGNVLHYTLSIDMQNSTQSTEIAHFSIQARYENDSDDDVVARPVGNDETIEVAPGERIIWQWSDPSDARLNQSNPTVSVSMQTDSARGLLAIQNEPIPAFQNIANTVKQVMGLPEGSQTAMYPLLLVLLAAIPAAGVVSTFGATGPGIGIGAMLFSSIWIFAGWAWLGQPLPFLLFPPLLITIAGIMLLRQRNLLG